LSSDSDFTAAIDAQLSEWRQGDAVIGGAIPLIRVVDLTQPITPEARQLAASLPVDNNNPLSTVGVEVPGLVIVSQSCDIVRSCKDRPYVEVAALAKEESSLSIHEIRKRRRPRYAYVPGVADQNLVADLHNKTTIEKAVLTRIDRGQRVRGCRNSQEARDFAAALAHVLSRTAFSQVIL
jgi:hypothetical protein